MKKTVYKVKVYSIVKDDYDLSLRMATEIGAEAMHGKILPETATSIDAEQLEPGEEWTPCDFKPRTS